MIKVEKLQVMNIDNAIRGARNPLSSWDRSDSKWDVHEVLGIFYFLGPNDLSLAERLCKSGPDHRKFLRQIFVSVDVTAPLYWWKEFDTYKVGTCANSTSTMHTIHKQEITRDMFSLDLHTPSDDILISYLEELRLTYLETKNPEVWRALIQRLPSSFNQRRTVTMTYENLVNMYKNRRAHKLSEWVDFCKEMEKVPYFKEMILSSIK